MMYFWLFLTGLSVGYTLGHAYARSFLAKWAYKESEGMHEKIGKKWFVIIEEQKFLELKRRWIGSRLDNPFSVDKRSP